jgi:O-antigen/teichoic acid export membrane protein
VSARSVSKDAVSVLGARAVWTVISMATGIILARKLGPHDRGILALVILLPSTVITVAKFGITQANVYFINREQYSASAVASNSTSLALVLSAISCTVCWLLRDWLFSTVLPGVEPWALALALARVPILLLDDYLYGVLQATGHFNLYNSRLILSESLRVLLIVLALLVLHLGLFAAVLIYTLVSVVNIVWLVFSTYRLIPFSLRVDFKLLKGQLEFGAKSYVQTLTSHLLLRIDVYMVAALLKNPAEAAFYSLALRFTEMVLEIPQAVGLVLYPRLAALEEEEIYRLTAQACRRTLLFSGSGAFLIGVLGPWLITIWYGKAYAPAGAPLPWAAVGVVAMSIFVILTRAFTSRHRQQVNIAAGMVALVSNVVLNLFLIPTMGIVGASMATAISYSGACVLLMAAFLAQSRLSVIDVLMPNLEDLRYLLDVCQQSAERGLRRLRVSPSKPQ